MKGRDILKGMINAPAQAKTDAPQPVLPHKPAGAVRAMNLSLNRLGEQAAAAKELREAIAAGDKVIELDPASVESAFIQDRIPSEIDPEFELLVASIRESGQQVPILVRPHPSREDHYQAAYGHRRLRAAQALELPVKAIVRKLSDEEVILAQGHENGQRVDLSFIERAFFAKRMDEHGFDRRTISKVLSVDTPETSRLLQVADAVDIQMIMAIGPAPKVGRPRWLAFVERLKDASAAKRAEKELSSPEFAVADSNARFDRVWKAVQQPTKTKAVELIRTKKGLLLASLENNARGAKMTVTSREFAEFLSERMAELVSAFEQETSVKTVD